MYGSGGNLVACQPIGYFPNNKDSIPILKAGENKQMVQRFQTGLSHERKMKTCKI